MKRRALVLTTPLILSLGLFFLTHQKEAPNHLPEESVLESTRAGLPGQNEKTALAPSAQEEPGVLTDLTVENASGIPLENIPAGVRLVEEVLFEKTVVQEDGIKRRSRVLRTDFHYPLLRTVEFLEANPNSGKDEVIGYQSMVADHVLVQLDLNESPENWQKEFAARGLEVRKEITADGLYVMSYDLTEADQISRTVNELKEGYAWVTFAEPDFIVTKASHDDPPLPNDPSFSQLWGLENWYLAGRDINAREGWRLRTDASDVIVAVIDSGIDYTHPDLQANMWVNPREERDFLDNSGDGYIDDIHGVNLITGSGDPMDDHSHGTHCAGTIGAVGDNGIGVTGVAWKVQLMAVKFLGLGGGGATSDAIRGIDYAWQNGADVLNNSWGGDHFGRRVGSSRALEEAILRVRNADAIFVTAAGNDSKSVDVAPVYPSNHQNRADNVVNVAAINEWGHLASFSNFGPEKVHVAAPGERIYSTVLNHGYAPLDGTSMAAPHVSGVFALLKAEFPDETYDVLIERLLQRSDRQSHLSESVQLGRRVNLGRALDPEPLIHNPLKDFVFLPGADVTLTVGVSGPGGDPSYRWYKDGSLLAGAGGGSLALGSATSALSGVYRVEVTTSYGTSISEATVLEAPVRDDLGQVLGAPELSWTTGADSVWTVVEADGDEPAAAQTEGVPDGSVSSLGTTVTGPGTLTFSWKVSSELNYDYFSFLLDGEIQEEISGESGWLHRTYAIPSGVHELTWNYTKDTGSAAGMDAAWLANVSYQNDHPVIDDHSPSLEVLAGTDVNLYLNARGSGTLTYFWKKNDVLQGGEESAQLTLDAVTLADAGSYVGTVANSHGADHTLPIHLSVVETANPPSFVNHPADFEGKVGAGITLTATWEGTSPFSRQWLKNGEPLPGETNRSLTLEGMGIEDSGAYTVIVTNTAGSKESFPALIEISPPNETFVGWVSRHGGMAMVEEASGNISPLVRFALGIGLEEPAEGRLPRFALVAEPRVDVSAGTESPDSGGPFFAALKFEHPIDIAGISYALEASDDLTEWIEVDSSLEVLDITEDERAVVQLRELQPASEHSERRFLRLRIHAAE